MDKKNTTEDTSDIETPERRRLITTGALTAASALLGGLVAAACTEDAAESQTRGVGDGTGAGSGGVGGAGAGTGTGGSGGAASKPDADIERLNALLAAEYKAITAYSAGASLIMNAPQSDPLYALRTVIVSVAVDFQAHHKLHAEALAEAISDLKGTPVDEAATAATFKPPSQLTENPTITNVLKFAAAAERSATVSYNQVLAELEDARFRLLASSIGGDESQHFIVLAALVIGLAAPGPKLSADTADDVVPQAFVTTIDDYDGLDKAPPDYFA